MIALYVFPQRIWVYSDYIKVIDHNGIYTFYDIQNGKLIEMTLERKKEIADDKKQSRK